MFCFFLSSKVIKKSLNSRNQDFSTFFCLLMEGSGYGPWSGSVQIIRIRIRNTGVFAWFLIFFEVLSIVKNNDECYAFAESLAKGESKDAGAGAAGRLLSSHFIYTNIHKIANCQRRLAEISALQIKSKIIRTILFKKRQKKKKFVLKKWKNIHVN